jgi:hypothetical protein
MLNNVIGIVIDSLNIKSSFVCVRIGNIHIFPGNGKKTVALTL